MIHNLEIITLAIKVSGYLDGVLTLDEMGNQTGEPVNYLNFTIYRRI